MVRTITIYGLALGASTLLLAWLDYKHLVHAYSTPFYVTCIAMFFAVLGAWFGNRLTVKQRLSGFTRNDAALTSLGISARECEVLELIAAGNSNKAIARRLSISPNTVKTHAAHLFEKLDVSSRTQAILKARSLDIIP
jgi:DNA-binding NarL/FixJ family response regulator